jgi:hypothetical protein
MFLAFDSPTNYQYHLSDKIVVQKREKKEAKNNQDRIMGIFVSSFFS